MYRPTLELDLWNPYVGLRGLQQDMNRLLEGFGPSRLAGSFPALNVRTNDDGAVVTAEVPGINPEDLDIKVMKNMLTIQGERKADAPADGVVCHRSERPKGRFARSLRLPFDVENSHVKARFDKGVLTITLPRAEATKPKRIEIITD